MNRRTAVAAVACVCVVGPACGRHKAAAVVIVGQDNKVTVMGQVEFSSEGGSFRPNIWKPGNVVVFRVDGTLGGEPGKAGQAYRIDKNKKLDELESVDLTRSDAELAGRYGVKASEKK